MTELILIRHGETEYNREMRFLGHMHLPLNEEGREQARKLMPVIADEMPDRIYCSDLERCVETAQIILPGRDIEYTGALREMDFGVFEGLTYSEIKEQHADELSLWENNRAGHRITGGESFTDMAERVLEQMRIITGQREGKYVIISHSGCIRTILSHYILGTVGDTWRFMVDNCKVSRLVTGDDYAYLKSLNEK